LGISAWRTAVEAPGLRGASEVQVLEGRLPGASAPSMKPSPEWARDERERGIPGYGLGAPGWDAVRRADAGLDGGGSSLTAVSDGDGVGTTWWWFETGGAYGHGSVIRGVPAPGDRGHSSVEPRGGCAPRGCGNVFAAGDTAFFALPQPGGGGPAWVPLGPRPIRPGRGVAGTSRQAGDGARRGFAGVRYGYGGTAVVKVLA